jgi:hypothetical protein
MGIVSPGRAGEAVPAHDHPAIAHSAQSTSNHKAIAMTDGSEDHKLARDIIDVHGREAATVARENARAAALAGQAAQAKSWIRVLGNIQRQQAGKALSDRTTGASSSDTAAWKE